MRFYQYFCRRLSCGRFKFNCGEYGSFTAFRGIPPPKWPILCRVGR